MSAPHYDIAVVGLGAMGSMAALEGTRRGLAVIGFDRFSPPHALGSSHGLTRIIREAYAEGTGYVPLVHRAYERWAELERTSGRRLFTSTGGLMVGRPEWPLVAGALRSAVAYGLAHEELPASELMRRFPAFRIPADFMGLFEPRAGILDPEAGIDIALGLARQGGADLHMNEPVSSWDAGDRITIVTERGSYTADRLVLSAGAWMSTPMAQLDVPLSPTRQVMFWFRPQRNPEQFAVGRFPVFMFEWTHDRIIYGFPDQGDGFKFGIHYEGTPSDPNTVDRRVSAADENAVRPMLERFFPDAAGPAIRSAVCLYTNTQDEHFVLDRHPADDRVVVCSACSGHGYKFAPVLGEILVDLATGTESGFDLSAFRIDRPDLRSGLAHPAHRLARAE
ncbi:MAG: N-methyl-L-tryptophan oxidase [Gemmatimonadota bacterium]